MDKMTGTDVMPKGTVDGRVLASVQGRGTAGQIGVLCYYSFGSMAVPYDEMKAYWLAQYLEFEGYMPRRPTQKDSFMCACSQDNVDIWNELERDVIAEFEKTMKSTVRVEYQSMPTKDGKNEYVLARRVWLGEKGEEITPFQPNVARLSLDKVADRVTVIPFEDYKSAGIVNDIDKLINAEYQRQKDIVNRNKHAQAFYRMQEDAGMVPFGFGSGCVFVPMDAVYLVASYSRYIKNVASKLQSCGPMLVPVYDEEDMKRRLPERAD
jgi:hypothetical protein